MVAKKRKSTKAGRPRRGESARERSSYTLPPAQVLWLREEAARYGVSRSQLLESVITQAQHGIAAQALPPQLTEIIPFGKLAEVCERFGVHSLRVFGSRLGTKVTAESDLDLLVEFCPDHAVGYVHFMQFQQALQELFGDIQVDLRTPEDLSELFRARVLSGAVYIYRSAAHAR